MIVMEKLMFDIDVEISAKICFKKKGMAIVRHNTTYKIVEVIE